MHSRTLAIAIAVAVAAEACCCCTALGGPEPPYPIHPSQEAIDEFNARLEHSNPTEGDDGLVYFSIYLTEDEATSLIVDKLQERSESLPIEQPQIHFRDGQIEVYLTFMISDQFPLPAKVALSPASAAEGITLTLSEIVLGPLPLPGSIVGSLGDMVSDMVSDALANVAEGATVSNLEIDEGRLLILFRVNQDDL